MRHLYYLSSASFSQVDLGILAELSKEYKITYSLVMPSNDPYLTIGEIKAYCSKHDIVFRPFVFTKRQRDVRIGFEFLRILFDLRKAKPDIIYTISFDIPILSLLCLLMNRDKTVVGIHDVEFHSSVEFRALLSIGRTIVTTNFKTFQVFSTNQEMAFRKKYPKKTVFNIPLSLGYYGNTGVSPDNQALDEYNVIHFLFFGNILPYKGLENLLHAVNNLSRKYSNFKLTIAGRCNNWNEKYEPIIKSNSHITKMIHHIDNNMLINIFSHAHYLVLPYRDGTQSGPLMIAYNHNLPVIASNIDSFKELVHDGITGSLYDRTKKKGLEEILEAAILRNKADYTELLKRQKAHVEISYSTKEIAGLYKSMFNSIK